VLNKPEGILSTVSDERGRRTVINLLPQRYRNFRLYPVGRLDKDSSGLILLTNDGDLAHRLTHPRFEHEKEYEVLIKGTLKPGEIYRLEAGIKLEDGITSPAMVKKLKTADNKYSITIHEGKKRQLRRMLEALGYPVLELKRVRIGSIKMGTLKEGGVREVGRIEV
jgi:23S rRNA pseudouridine2605 synthase